ANPWLSFVALLAAGALDNISVVVRGTLMQTLTPDEMRGRVAAINVVFISSSNELGEFESGLTAHWFGAVPSGVGGGVGALLVVLAVARRWPALLRLGSLRELRAETPAPGAFTPPPNPSPPEAGRGSKQRSPSPPASGGEGLG